MKQVEIIGAAGKSLRVKCFGEFEHEIGGETFAFLITSDVNNLELHKCVTHKASGLRVCGLSVGAAYLPAYAKLDSDEARAKLALDALCEKHGEARVRSKLAAAEPPKRPANPTAPDTRDDAGNTVNPQWDRFETVLTAQYKYLFEAFPSEYMWAMQKSGTPANLAKKMTLGLADGSANKDGEGIKRACKALGIKHTYKAIRAYLTPAG